jgi:hypothetical protein
MITWSVVLGVLGLFASGAALASLSRVKSPQRPEWLWLLGLVALAPAWLIGFISLLGSPIEKRPWILSSGAALLGVIATDAALRRLQESGRALRPVTYWLLGVVALLPGWCVALYRGLGPR